MTDDLTTRDDGVLERTADGGVTRFERHLAYDVGDVWNAITSPARLADWWLPFEADITVDLREGGEMVFAGTPDGEPVTLTCTIVRLEPPLFLEHTHPAPGSTMRWELEAVETGCILRLSHHVPDNQEAIDNCYLVGLQTSLCPGGCVMSAPTEQLLRVQNFLLSTDGYGNQLCRRSCPVPGLRPRRRHRCACQSRDLPPRLVLHRIPIYIPPYGPSPRVPHRSNARSVAVVQHRHGDRPR